MRFAVEVGQLERNRLEYHFNQLLGTLLIRVNDQTVRRSVRLINEPVFEVFDLDVGQLERCRVRIEKERKPLIGHRNRVYVDNRLTRVFEGF